MSSVPASSSMVSPADVAERVRSLQLGSSERRTADFGFRGLRWLLFLALIAGGVWWFTQHRDELNVNWQQWMPGKQPTWEVVPVKVQGGEEVLLDLTGYISPKRKVNVTARIPGLLVELLHDEGDRVEAGQILARLDDTSFQADHDQALAALTAAESRLEEMQNGALPEELEQSRTAVQQARDKVRLTEKELARMEKLKNDIPAAEWDQLESTLSDAKANVKTLEQKLKLLEGGPRAERMKAAESEVTQARALVTKAKIALDNTVITAPITGVILERHGEAGEQLRPDALASGLFVLADLEHLEVQVDVEEQSLSKLRIGQACKVIPDAYANRTYPARIARWQLQVNRARAVVRVILTITEPDELLLAEMNCRAVILESSQPAEAETYWIPAAAAVSHEGKTAVYVAEGGVARLRLVQFGTERDSLRQVMSGITKTDLIVLPGPQPLADGQKVP